MANTGNLRSSSEAFIFHTGNDPYVLTEESFKKQVDSDLPRSRSWHWPKIKLLSFTDGVVKLRLTHEESHYEMTVKIEEFKLSCSCSCNTPVQTVCLHVYRALQSLSGYAGLEYFSDFSPSGIVTLARKYPSCFTKNASDLGNDYTPKTNLDRVYYFSHSRYPLFEPKSMALPTQIPAAIPEREACMVILTCYRIDRFPAIIPCSGLLDMAGEKIKLFDPFLSYPQLLTADQQTLNLLGLEMWKLVEKLPRGFRNFEEEHTKPAEKLLQLWEEALPLLSMQTFLYSYRMNRERELRKKPRKNEMIQYSISKDRPVLQFVLLDCGIYYQFYPELRIRDKSFSGFGYAAPLLISIDDKLYLLNSLRDAAILETMEKVTVFKEQYSAFEAEILIHLRKHYTIKTVSRRKKK